MAEYTALGKGLRYVLDRAAELAAYRLVACGDSQLVIKQVRGEMRCHNERLSKLLARVREVCGELEAAGCPPVVYQWVPRGENTDADGLSVRAWEEATGRPMPVRVKAVSRRPTPSLFDDSAPGG